MADQVYSKLQNSLICIASEFFRFQSVYEKAINRIDMDERNKYISQFSWFSKKVIKALDESNIKIINLEGQIYDPGMAVTPINIDDFETDEGLYVMKTIEPIIMKEEKVVKIGTVILGRIEE